MPIYPVVRPATVRVVIETVVITAIEIYIQSELIPFGIQDLKLEHVTPSRMFWSVAENDFEVIGIYSFNLSTEFLQN